MNRFWTSQRRRSNFEYPMITVTPLKVLVHRATVVPPNSNQPRGARKIMEYIAKISNVVPCLTTATLRAYLPINGTDFEASGTYHRLHTDKGVQRAIIVVLNCTKVPLPHIVELPRPGLASSEHRQPFRIVERELARPGSAPSSRSGWTFALCDRALSMQARSMPVGDCCNSILTGLAGTTQFTSQICRTLAARTSFVSTGPRVPRH